MGLAWAGASKSPALVRRILSSLQLMLLYQVAVNPANLFVLQSFGHPVTCAQK